MFLLMACTAQGAELTTVQILVTPDTVVGTHETLDDRWEIGSVSKVFNSMLLIDAIAQGQVTLTDELRTWLPDAPPGVTLEQLASHTSGLSRLPKNMNLRWLLSNAVDPYGPYGMDELSKGLRKAKPRDNDYAYSNFGAGALGAALTVASGREWSELLAERIAAPLGLTHTDTSDTDLRQGHTAQGADAAPWHWTSALAGAGAVRSTPQDLVTFTRWWMDPAEPWTEMLAPRADAGGGMQVGLGWHLKTVDGVDWMWHNGAVGGFSSFVAVDPAGDRAVIVLTDGLVPNDTTATGFVRMGDFSLPDTP